MSYDVRILLENSCESRYILFYPEKDKYYKSKMYLDKDNK